MMQIAKFSTVNSMNICVLLGTSALAGCSLMNAKLPPCPKEGDTFVYIDAKNRAYNFTIISKETIEVIFNFKEENNEGASPLLLLYHLDEKRVFLRGFFDIEKKSIEFPYRTSGNGKCKFESKGKVAGRNTFRCERTEEKDFMIEYDSEIGLTAFWLDGDPADDIARLSSPIGFGRFCDSKP